MRCFLFTDDTEGLSRNSRAIRRFLLFMQSHKLPKLTKADFVIHKKRRKICPVTAFKTKLPGPRELATMAALKH